MAVIIRVLIEPVLMLLCTSHIIFERQDLHRNPFMVLTHPDEKFGPLQVFRIFTVEPRPVLLTDILTLPVHAVGIDDFEQMIHEFLD